LSASRTTWSVQDAGSRAISAALTGSPWYRLSSTSSENVTPQPKVTPAGLRSSTVTFGAGVTQLGQDGEVQAGGPPADAYDLHVVSPSGADRAAA